MHAPCTPSHNNASCGCHPGHTLQHGSCFRSLTHLSYSPGRGMEHLGHVPIRGDLAAWDEAAQLQPFSRRCVGSPHINGRYMLHVCAALHASCAPAGWGADFTIRNCLAWSCIQTTVNPHVCTCTLCFHQHCLCQSSSCVADTLPVDGPGLPHTPGSHRAWVSGVWRVLQGPRFPQDW
jgi:hypothetical protein